MGIRMRDAAGTLRTIARVRMRDAGGVLRTIQRIRMRDGAGTLRTVFQYFTAVLSHSTINAFASGASPSGTVTSGAVSVTVTGGTSPYTYAWERVSGDPDVEITSPTGSSTTFFVTTAYDGFTYEAVFKCTVTDNTGEVTSSGTVTVKCFWVNTT